MSVANVIVDTRECNCKVPGLLGDATGIVPEQRELTVGDYQISDDICFERKTWSDLYNSVIDKRLFYQLPELKREFSKPCIILEGNFKEANRNHYIDKNLIRSVILSIALNYQIPIIPTTDEKDTSIYIKRAVQRLNRPKSNLIPLQTRPKPKDPVELEQFIWESMPMIGPVLAKDLTESPGSLLEKLNNVDNLEVAKFGPKKRQTIKTVLGVV